MGDTTSARLCLKTLGSFEVIVDGAPVPEEAWPRRKTKGLLKLLLTAPGDVFTVDQLIDALLPDSDVGRAGSNIRARVSELRSVLEPDLQRGATSQYVKRIGEGYSFCPDSDSWLDTFAFERQVSEGHRNAGARRLPEAIDALESAIALYRGEFLAEDRYAEWAESKRSQLRERFLGGLARLAACQAKLGRLHEAAASCRRALAIDPCRESVARQLMKVQTKIGQRAQAVRTYKRLQQSLLRELDVEPSEETKTLYRQISQRGPGEVDHFDPHRVAVIPFVNVGSNPSNEFLADGMTEELIFALSKVSGLEVIAQTTVLKYKGVRKSVAEIGQELQVGTLLEGSTQRAHDKARVLVQLIRVDNEAHIWAEQYDRDLQDILNVQGDIARRVATALEVHLLAREEKALRTVEIVSPEAHAACLKGGLFISRRTRDSYVKAIECFEQSLSIAPDYARALAGLADAHSLMVRFSSDSDGYVRARRYVERALALDPLCANAHATLGYILWLGEGDIPRAEREFLQAIDLNPNCAQAHEWYADLLVHTGRVQEACRQSEDALALDPLSSPLVQIYAQSLHAAGRLDEAVVQYRKALEMNPELEGAWWGLWYSLAAAWDWDRAEALTREIIKEHPGNPFAYVNLATCVMCRGRLEEGLVEIRKALQLAGDPKRASIVVHVGHCHYFARKFDEAIEHYRWVLEGNPTWNYVHNMIAKCYILQMRYDEALDELEASERVFGGADPFWNTHVHMDRGKIYARRGETDKARRELEILMRSSGRLNRHIAIAGVLSALGEVDEAMDWLDAAATAREPHVAALRKSPELDPLRSHPRYQALLKRIGLAD